MKKTKDEARLDRLVNEARAIDKRCNTINGLERALERKRLRLFKVGLAKWVGVQELADRIRAKKRAAR